MVPGAAVDPGERDIAPAPQGALLNLAITGNADPQATAVRQQQVIDLACPEGSPFVPAIAPNGVVKGASILTGAVAPGSERNRFDTEVSGVRVLLDAVAAPILFASGSQITVVVPRAMAGRTSAAVRVETAGGTTARVNVGIAEATPGIFTADQSGRGQAPAVNRKGARRRARR